MSGVRVPHPHPKDAPKYTESVNQTEPIYFAELCVADTCYVSVLLTGKEGAICRWSGVAAGKLLRS